MLATAVKLIIENIPDIQALDLSDNKLSSVDALKILVDKTSHLKVLHVGNNRVGPSLIYIYFNFGVLLNEM